MAISKVGKIGKKAELWFDDGRVPRKSAPLRNRAAWAAAYLRNVEQRIPVTRKKLKLALGWIDELVALNERAQALLKRSAP